MDKTDFRFDKEKLDNIKKFIESSPYVKIGVLASHAPRTPKKGEKSSIDAVVLAAVHEFGSTKRHIPPRSFLQKTMDKNENDFKQDMYVMRDEHLETIAEGNGVKLMHDIGKKWVGYVHDTFEEEGPGWQALSQRRIAERKKVGGRAKGNKEPERYPILQDTRQMLRSISYEVVTE